MNPFTNLSLMPYEKLLEGMNKDVAILIKILCPVDRSHDGGLAVTFTAMILEEDKKRINFLGFTFYNIVNDAIKPGDFVAIAHPNAVNFLDKKIAVCADEPHCIAINGKKITQNQAKFVVI